ncbi:MAG: hypothetical protein JW727_00845 [Candidatus Aenigmarchaeota archaeon]|nr:hypothetical protein [Candidatus Aenigmarchaeota archaeon]
MKPGKYSGRDTSSSFREFAERKSRETSHTYPQHLPSLYKEDAPGDSPSGMAGITPAEPMRKKADPKRYPCCSL